MVPIDLYTVSIWQLLILYILDFISADYSVESIWHHPVYVVLNGTI